MNLLHRLLINLWPSWRLVVENKLLASPPMSRGYVPDRCKKFVSFPKRPDRFQIPTTFPLMGWRAHFLLDWSCDGM